MHATVSCPRQRLRVFSAAGLCFALATAGLLALPATPAGARDASTAWGKRLVESFELTPEDLARLARHQDKTAGSKPAGFFSETVAWKALWTPNKYVNACARWATLNFCPFPPR